jgi:hypothetical protein
MEVFNDEEWENMKNFQSTKIEQKDGFNLQLDMIRVNLNKMTDKNYVEIKNKIIEIIDNIVDEKIDDESIINVSKIIFDIASTNRFYSRMYAIFYADLINKYEFMKNICEINLNEYIQLFDNIEYIESSVDYDKFCKINQDNEKRKSLMSFFINLMINNIITEEKIIFILKNLLLKINEFILIENKKNEVDELTENIAIIFKNILSKSNEDTNKHYINKIESFRKKVYLCKNNITDDDNSSIIEIIKKLAHSKPKQFLSLTNKSIFKFMDMIEM